ncbi:MAG: diguanylate cyclase [Pseudomonadales bacterium]
MDAHTWPILMRVAAATLASIVASVAITLSVIYYLTGSLAAAPMAVLIAVLVPALVAPLGSYFHIATLYRLREANDKLRVLSETDPLTGAHNRRRFMEHAEQQLALARRYCYPTSLLLLDFDSFKRVNDEHGHAMGDRVLVEMTEVMRGALRETDSIARFGGEEFVLLLPHTAREGALAVAERVRGAVREHVLKGDTGPVQITVSIGGVTCETSETPLGKLLSRADHLLYECKRAGRDRCFVEAKAGATPLPILQRQVPPRSQSDDSQPRNP